MGVINQPTSHLGCHLVGITFKIHVRERLGLACVCRTGQAWEKKVIRIKEQKIRFQVQVKLIPSPITHSPNPADISATAVLGLSETGHQDWCEG
jgi:hypothetical protein